MTKYIALLLVTMTSFGQAKDKKLVWEENFNEKQLN